MTPVLAHGLSYPQTRAQAYRVGPRGPYFTRHRLLLLEGPAKTSSPARSRHVRSYSAGTGCTRATATA